MINNKFLYINMDNVTINIEYCGTCGYVNKFQELNDYIAKECKNVNIDGHQGGRGTFEVKVNGTLVHSKLTTLAFPDYKEIADIVKEVSEGKEVRKVNVHQPITDCIIL